MNISKVYKKNLGFLKIIFINISLLIFGFLFIELIFKLSEKKPLIIKSKYPIPKLNCNTKLKYEVSHLYNQKESKKSYYIKNSKCYRSYQEKSKLPKILTIGGSTTDQIYITEGKTFQDLLDIKLQNKFDFINGGVDGQSSAGHLFSIKNWHSKALDEKKINEIIYYIGINDRNLFIENKKFLVNYTFKRKLLDTLNSNSKLFRFFKSIFHSKNLPKDFDPLAAHTAKFDFIDTNKLTYIDPKFRSKNYEEGIKELILSTINLFPYSSIKIVQQQIPGCKFIKKTIVIDRHGHDSTMCMQLGGAYLGIDNVVEKLSEINKSKISVHKMYLVNILRDEDVYDAVHTNNNGSEKISKYIYSLYE